MIYAELNNLAKEYNFKIKLINQNTFTIKSVCDDWFAEFDTEREKMFLHHKNTKTSKGYNKKHYHLQKAFNILDFKKLFEKIKTHDNFVLNHKSKTDNLEKLFGLIKDKKSNYVKLN